MSAFSARAEFFRKLYLTGPKAQVLRMVRPLAGARAIVSLDGDTRTVVHFGSNNYLGLATHPYVLERAKASLDEFGLSVCGSPLLNGATQPLRDLEIQLANLKGTEDAIVFSSGYAANQAWTQALIRESDQVYFDSLAHTSFLEGVKHISRQSLQKLNHHSPPSEHLTVPKPNQNVFVFVEGVYSMHGDIAPLGLYSAWCSDNGATLVVDDAHGTGTLGQRGRGVFEHHNLAVSDAIVVGTLSKGLGGTGGFICADADTILCLRASANSSIFSASLPPPVVAGVMAAIEILSKEPEHTEKLQRNVRHLAHALSSIGVHGDHASPILSISVPKRLNVQSIVRNLHRKDIYVNGVSYPAVPKNDQRIRISVSAEHSEADLDYLTEVLVSELA